MKEKLEKMLCPLSNCSGYLYNSINIDREPVKRCKDCHNWITEIDYDILTINKINNDEIYEV